MKTTFQLLALALISLVFSSCCSIFPCGGSNATYKNVTTYTEKERTVYTGKSSHTVTDRVPHTKKVKVSKRCTKCGSKFSPKRGCCDVVSKSVLSRATAQGGNGEPHIGLIPTMKTLAE